MKEYKEAVRLLCGIALIALVIFMVNNERSEKEEFDSIYKYRIEREVSVGFNPTGNPLNTYKKYYWTDSIERRDGCINFFDQYDANQTELCSYYQIIHLR
jgi:hypothetical protein